MQPGKDTETPTQSTLVSSASSANLVKGIRLPNKNTGLVADTVSMASSVDLGKENTTPGLTEKLSMTTGAKKPLELSSSVDISRSSTLAESSSIRKQPSSTRRQTG